MKPARPPAMSMPDYRWVADAILAVGDSISTNYMGGGVPFPELLANARSLPYASQAVSGNTSAIVLATLPFLLAAAPACVSPLISVLCGVNDALANVPAATTRANYQAIEATLRAAYPRGRLVFGTPIAVQPGGLTGPQETILQADRASVRASRGTVGDYAIEFPSSPAYYLDLYHPNTLGQAYLSTLLARAANLR